MADRASVTIPYTPRSYLKPYHASRKPNRFMVFHRRSGKTVGIGNDHIKSAITNPRQYPPPRYAYVGPSFGQAKDTIWDYLKHYTKPIPGMQVSESDLWVQFPNGARITLYPGADAYERMRGLYFDGVAMDEFPLLNPDALESVIWPCLADYDGRLTVAGTSNGDDHFHELKKQAEANEDEWDVFDVRVGYGESFEKGNLRVIYSEEEALKEKVVARLRRSMTPAKFNREMLNDFSAPVEGAYYGEDIQLGEDEGRHGVFPVDKRFPVVVWWDLGTADTMVLWFAQRIGGQIRLVDYEEGVGKGVDHFLDKCARKPFNVSMHVFPHDVAQRQRLTARSVQDHLDDNNVPYVVCPSMAPTERIHAVRMVLNQCYFNVPACAAGVSALRSYKSGNNGKPLHNWASHPADAFGYGVMMLDVVREWGGAYGRSRGPLKRGIKGVV